MILAITSSGRRPSNSTILASVALEAASGAGPVEMIDLSKLTFRGCTGCGGCRKGAPGCVLVDDLTPVLAKISEAKALILAAPVYYGYVSGIFKSFLDRWYGFRDAEKNLRLPTGRPLLCLVTQGHPDPDAYAGMVGSLDKIFSAYGFLPHVQVAAALEPPGAAMKSHTHLDEATSQGIRLAASLQGKTD